MAALVGGCVVHEHGYVRTGARIRIESGHRCSGACDHYYSGGHYYYAGHVHGPGCGHVMRDGIWVAIR